MSTIGTHVCVSRSHRGLLEDHLRPTFSRFSRGAELIVQDVPQDCPTGVYGTPGWQDQARHKIEMALAAATAAGDGGVFACCDADVVFLGRWVEPALAALAGHEVAAIREPGFSPAFWLARSTPRLREMLSSRLERWGEWPGDGSALAAGFAEYGIDVGPLDERFANPGRLGHPLPLLFERATFDVPADTLLFHANFCALPDKGTLLAEVRRIAAGGGRRPNDELVAEGPEGLGFFPARRPDRPFDRQSMFARDKARDALEAVGDRPVGLIVEIGSWLGASTRWFLETFSGPRRDGEPHEHAAIVCIDPWAVDREWGRPDLDVRAMAAWEQFAANCWHLRQWITPVRLPSSEGLPAIAGELERQGRAPDLVFVDGDHSYEACSADVRFCAAAWPGALLLGDDYRISIAEDPHERPVADAVGETARETGRELSVGRSGIWALEPAPVAADAGPAAIRGAG